MQPVTNAPLLTPKMRYLLRLTRAGKSTFNSAQLAPLFFFKIVFLLRSRTSDI